MRARAHARAVGQRPHARAQKGAYPPWAQGSKVAPAQTLAGAGGGVAVAGARAPAVGQRSGTGAGDGAAVGRAGAGPKVRGRREPGFTTWCDEMWLNSGCEVLLAAILEGGWEQDNLEQARLL